MTGAEIADLIKWLAAILASGGVLLTAWLKTAALIWPPIPAQDPAGNITSILASIDAVALKHSDVLQSGQGDQEKAWSDIRKLLHEIREQNTEMQTEANKQRADILHSLAMLLEKLRNVKLFRAE